MSEWNKEAVDEFKKQHLSILEDAFNKLTLKDLIDNFIEMDKEDDDYKETYDVFFKSGFKVELDEESLEIIRHLREIVLTHERQTEKEQLTFGERLVGLSFNPSGDDKVTRVKRLCAELADLVENERPQDYAETDDNYYHIRNTLYKHTIHEILNAQMNVVKYITFR